MRPRLIVLRRILLPSARPTALRTFTQNTAVRTSLRARPQIPFLALPRTRVRFLTTQRRNWLKQELKNSVKVAVLVCLGLVSCTGILIVIYHEVLERRYPTPQQWSFLTRWYLLEAHAENKNPLNLPHMIIDWPLVVSKYQSVLQRLENPRVDGAGLVDTPGGGKDISAKPEAWRRGYFETLLAYAHAAEYVCGWQRDRTTGFVCAPEYIIGPENPRRKPMPLGSPTAPKAENCETAFPHPDEIYGKLLATEGLTLRQRLDAASACAAWNEYNHNLEVAGSYLAQAVDMSSKPDFPRLPPTPTINTDYTLKESAGPPSANLLHALTEYATFHARAGNVSLALPVLVSVLRARQSLAATAPPKPRPQAEIDPLENPFAKLSRVLGRALGQPAYPPPPDDGSAPPARDAQERCDEAALHLYIGEILYASSAAGRSREDGLGWTREAVDTAEEQLHALRAAAPRDRAARAKCRDCLAAGLGNWAAMVERLAREEALRQKLLPPGPAAAQGGWFAGLWGGGARAEDLSRWAAEGRVVMERQKRLKDVLDDLEPTDTPVSSIFTA